MSPGRELQRSRPASAPFLGLLAVSLLGCGRGPDEVPSRPWLVEAGAGKAPVFEHESGARGDYLFPEVMGAGVALFDADGDGLLDAYFTNGSSDLQGDPGGTQNRLFRQDGAGGRMVRDHEYKRK